MDSFTYPLTPSLELSEKHLVVPIVSAANVSQLAVDLIIATLSLKSLAVIDPAYFIPVTGKSEYGEGIVAPMELFGSPTKSVVIIQQRSPVLKSRKHDFVLALFDFIKSSSVASALFLSGVDLSDRTDAQMTTPIYQLRPANGPSLKQTCLDTLDTLPIPTYTSPVSPAPATIPDTSIPFIPGGGLTRRILRSTPENWLIPTASLLQFVLEGDNRADAAMLATVTLKVVGLDLDTTDWKQPKSWRQGLFGAPHDRVLYG